MAEDEPLTPAEDGEDDDGTAYAEQQERRRVNMLSLDEKVSALAARVEQFLSGSPARPGPAPRPAGRAGEAEDRRREIREELASLRRQERADRQARTMTARLKAVEAATVDRPPRELRRIEKMFRWDPGD
jgi:hypothetical protein